MSELLDLAARVEAAEDHERLILDALTDAYQSGNMAYVHYGPTWDVTAARAGALSFYAAALRARASTEREG